MFARSPLAASSAFAFAGAAGSFPVLPQAAPRLPGLYRGRHPLARAVRRLNESRVLGTCLVVSFLAASALYGAVRGGGYETFVAENGSLLDIAARTVGFPLKSVTITGAHELREAELLKLAGISSRNSLLFLDVAAIRKRLVAVPLIKEASVSKLLPDRLLIEIEERQPHALWQKDGLVSVVAQDGMSLAALEDTRFEKLPLVVGDDANKHLDDYFALLDMAGSLRDRVRAGILVSKRRWTLKMNNGVDVDLPEVDPGAALAQLALLEHDGRILEKDIISLDLRVPGRVVARLTEDAGAARAAALASKTKKKGAAT